MAKTLPQGNPTIDKMSQRVGLAGSGLLGPILKGFGGRIEITLERDERLSAARIYSDFFERELLGSGGSYTDIGNGRRLWTRDIVFGVDTDYGVTGALPIRNKLEWTIKKRGVHLPLADPVSTNDDRPFFAGTRTYTRVI
jgi:hypothetical protein